MSTKYYEKYRLDTFLSKRAEFFKQLAEKLPVGPNKTKHEHICQGLQYAIDIIETECPEVEFENTEFLKDDYCHKEWHGICKAFGVDSNKTSYIFINLGHVEHES